MRILLVDDDEVLLGVLTRHLTEQHYTVDVVTDGEAGWAYGSTFTYDLVILDLMLPKLDGIALCQRFRSHGYSMPILLLTAQDNSQEKIKGLNAGADDYVVKPFDFEELVARIRALLRRGNSSTAPVLEWEQLCLDPIRCEVTYAGQLLSLTPKEYALLELFLHHHQQIFSVGVILDSLWSSEEFPVEATVRSHLRRLRHKLSSAGAPDDLIETVHGLGYRLKPFGDTGSQAKILPIERESSRKQVKHAAMLAEAWEDYRDKSLERLNVLAQTARILRSGMLKLEQQEQARAEAHTLAGTLGTFGLDEASQLARKLEHLLETESSMMPDQASLFDVLVDALRVKIEGKSLKQAPLLTRENSPLLLIVDGDEDFTQPLVEAAATDGIQVAIAPTVSAARGYLAKAIISKRQHPPPDAILLRLSVPGSADEVRMARLEKLTLIEELAQQVPALPVLVMTDPICFVEQLEVTRRGGKLLIDNPMTPADAIAAVKQILGNAQPGAKVMVVDDDPHFLSALPPLLKPWGFELTMLDDPQQFWSVLKDVTPNLLVLDVEMPHISGIELCQVLRSNPSWSDLPVLFLSIHNDTETQNRAFAIGADDYVSKPVVGIDLANRILNRLERARLYQKSA